MNSYEMIFKQRGYKYGQAMAEFPKARAQEFQHLINQFNYLQGTVVADIPSGGEYLKQYLPAHCRYVGFDPCHSNFKQNISSVTDFFPLPINNHCIDITLSLAGLHHLENKIPLFEEFKRITKLGGSLGIADVYQGSAAAKFLDEFVSQHNEMGHEGAYLSEKTIKELKQADWHITSANRNSLLWVFDDKTNMGLFCQRLFNLSCSLEKIIASIENYLGIKILPHNLIGMHWELFTIVAA
jgi:SAM-dependent methyltransferase